MILEVNDQITDAVTQTNTQVVSNAPAVAMAQVYQAAAHSTGIMFANAVNAQNQQNILSQAVTTQGVIQLYSLNRMGNQNSIKKLLHAIEQLE